MTLVEDFVAHSRPRAVPAALAVLSEGERALEHLARRGRDRLDVDAAAGVERLAMLPGERRLVVERVHLARAAVHEQLNDSFGLGRMMQAAVEIRAWRRGELCFLAEELPERDAAEAAGGVRK